jgi:serine/threonine protein kinase
MAAGSLSHPNVVHIYEVGQTDGNSWIAFEFVHGCSLDRVIERGAIAWPRAVEMATQIAHGLAAAHAAGIIHRDLTVRNIMVTPEGGIKILDFGIAKLDCVISPANGAFTAEITGTGSIIGSPGYMAPEQVAGRPADARSDIFALGVLLYEMLSGLRAFRSSSPIETMSATLKEQPPDLPGAIPAPIQRITRRCLEKEANQRFQSASDVGFALAAFLDESVNSAPAIAAKYRISPKSLSFRERRYSLPPVL